jgi:hypothetical protein
VRTNRRADMPAQRHYRLLQGPRMDRLPPALGAKQFIRWRRRASSLLGSYIAAMNKIHTMPCPTWVRDFGIPLFMRLWLASGCHGLLTFGQSMLINPLGCSPSPTPSSCPDPGDDGLDKLQRLPLYIGSSSLPKLPSTDTATAALHLNLRSLIHS